MVKIDKRGLWWKKVSKADRSKKLSENRRKGWANISAEARSAHAIKLNEARWGKK